MAFSRLIALAFTFSLLQISTNSFGQIDKEWSSLKRKEGIYFTLESFLSNQPDILWSQLVDKPNFVLEGVWNMRSINCFDGFKFLNDSGHLVKVGAKTIWAVVMGDRPYVMDRQWRKASEKRCLCKLYSPGYLIRYTIYNYSLPQRGSDGTLTGGTVKELQFAIDIRTGKVYNLKSDWKDLANIIRKSGDFQQAKITKRNIHNFIYDYNEGFDASKFFLN